MKELLQRAKQLQPELVENRRWLHRHPELGFDLTETCAFVEEKLKAMGCDVIQGYLYSKPLLTDDFQSFVNGTTDLESVMKRNVEAPYKKPKYIDFLINK